MMMRHSSIPPRLPVVLFEDDKQINAWEGDTEAGQWIGVSNDSEYSMRDSPPADCTSRCLRLAKDYFEAADRHQHAVNKTWKEISLENSCADVRQISPSTARPETSETTFLELGAKDKNKALITRIALRLLDACLTLDHGYVLPDISSPVQAESSHGSVESIHIGLVSSLRLHLYYSQFPAFGHHARSPSIGIGPTAEFAEASCNGVVVVTSQCATDQENLLINSTTGSSFRHHRRCYTRISSSEEHEELITEPKGNASRKRRGRSMEDPTRDSKVKRRLHPIKSHLIQQWNRLRSKVRNASSRGQSDNSFRIKISGNSCTASTHATDATSKNHAGTLYISPLARRQVNRTVSAPATIQVSKNFQQRACFNLVLTPSPAEVENMESNSTTEDDESDGTMSFLVCREVQSRPSLGVRMFSEPVQRRSTAATVVYKPPIIAQASPNSEKLTSVGSSNNSSSGTSVGLTDLMSFL